MAFAVLEEEQLEKLIEAATERGTVRGFELAREIYKDAKPDDSEELVTLKDIAKEYKKSIQTIRRKVAQRNIPTEVVKGGFYAIKKKDIQELLKG